MAWWVSLFFNFLKKDFGYPFTDAPVTQATNTAFARRLSAQALLPPESPAPPAPRRPVSPQTVPSGTSPSVCLHPIYHAPFRSVKLMSPQRATPAPPSRTRTSSPPPISSPGTPPSAPPAPISGPATPTASAPERTVRRARPRRPCRRTRRRHPRRGPGGCGAVAHAGEQHYQLVRQVRAGAEPGGLLLGVCGADRARYR